MCGISGVFYIQKNKKSKYFFQDKVKAISKSINHRGPDSNNFWIEESENIYFAHNRLKIIDLTEMGNQPMTSYTGNLVIIYNGEIYNHQYIKEKLLDESENKISFKSRTDTEVLLNAIDFWGLKKTLEEIKGMFSFALWNKKEKKLSLCRDRFGEKPLYYFFYDDGIFFSSEIKSFHNLDNSKEISDKNLNFFKTYGYNLNNDTIFKNIKQIPPGSFGYLDESNLIKKKVDLYTYWEPSKVALKSLNKLNLNSVENICEITEKLLKNIIKDQLIADVETGVFLSGGTDSALVTAISQELSKKRISTFSIGFDVKEYDESSDARMIAKTLDTDHKEYIMTSDDLVNILQSGCLLDEPFYDISQYPTYLLSKFASKHVRVCLSGDGGDEIFGGYNRYLIGQNNYLNLLKLIKFFNLQKVTSSFIDKKLANLFLRKFGLTQLENKKDKLKALISSKSEEDLYDKLLRVENLSNVENVIEYKKISNITDNFMINDIDKYLPNNILYKVDSLSMLNSLETRAPFLDHELYQFAWTIPQKIKFYKKNSKFILKSILSKYASKELFDKPKMGFDIPLFQWLKNSPKLRKLIKELYLMNNKKIESLIPNSNNEQFDISPNNFSKIWKIALIKKWIVENF